MAERIISFDILRGWAILGNLAVHTFMMTTQIEGLAESNPGELTLVGFIIMGLVVVFGHWRGLFLLVSGIVHMMVMQMKYKRGVRREVILVQELIKGLLLWLWSMFFYVFLAQWGPSKAWAEQRGVTINWEEIYHADQFANIAWAIMISAVVFYILTSHEKLRKPLVMTAVFAVVGLTFIFAAPALHQLIIDFWRVDMHSNIPSQYTGFFGSLGYSGWQGYFDNIGFTGTWDYVIRYRGGSLSYIGEKGWWDYIVRMLANQMDGRESPLLPHFAYSAVGSILGIWISQDKKPDKKKFLSWGYGIAGGSIAFGAFWLFVVQKIPEDPFMLVDFHVHPTWFMFVTIGMLLFVVLGLMHGHEFSRKVNWKKRLKWSRFSRRVGFLSLSVYSFAAIQSVWRVIYGAIFPLQGFRTAFGLNLGFYVLLILTEFIFWFGFLWLWEKWNFNLSGEWLFAFILKRPAQRKKKDKPKLFGDFLDVKGRVKEVTPVHWVDPLPPEGIEKDGKLRAMIHKIKFKKKELGSSAVAASETSNNS
ncbi:MAG: hypothetical protein ACTSQF_11920 [Candidatus Heimdallarchaeaceae archaeon]